MKKTLIVVLLFAFLIILVKVSAQTEEQPKIDYYNQPVVDSDLDGLTDEGERQLYDTDPNVADTDGDGFGDGVEILSGTDPLNQESLPGATESIEGQQEKEVPWAWYASRVTGLVGFLLLYVSILLGLSIRIPFLRKIISPVYSMSVHCWISVQALVLIFIHAMSLLFDKAFKFSIADLFVPFVTDFETNLIALGIMAFYLMILLILTSYGRKFISQKTWRITHFANIAVYIFVLIHAFYLGTDIKNPYIYWIFLIANALLIFLMLINLESRIFKVFSLRSKNNDLLK